MKQRTSILLAFVSAAAFGLACPLEDLPCSSDLECPHPLVCSIPSDANEGLCATAPQASCEESGGLWDEGACGHYVCGEPNPCRALIPGCDCGIGENFDVDMGCLPDPNCAPTCEFDADCPSGWLCESSIGCPPGAACIGEGGPAVCAQTPAHLCESTGGRWDLTSCGDYVCGRHLSCLVVIPGCDCGPQQGFDETIGCAADPDCP